MRITDALVTAIREELMISDAAHLTQTQTYAILETPDVQAALDEACKPAEPPSLGRIHFETPTTLPDHTSADHGSPD